MLLYQYVPPVDEERVSWGTVAKTFCETKAGLSPFEADPCGSGSESRNNQRELLVVQPYSVVLHKGNGTIGPLEGQLSLWGTD